MIQGCWHNSQNVHSCNLDNNPWKTINPIRQYDTQWGLGSWWRGREERLEGGGGGGRHSSVSIIITLLGKCIRFVKSPPELLKVELIHVLILVCRSILCIPAWEHYLMVNGWLLLLCSGYFNCNSDFPCHHNISNKKGTKFLLRY